MTDQLYQIAYKPSAAKSLRKLDKPMQQRLVSAVESLAHDPRPAGVKKLKGAADLYRIRVGDYRVVYEIWDGKLRVLVLRLAHRREVYQK